MALTTTPNSAKFTAFVRSVDDAVVLCVAERVMMAADFAVSKAQSTSSPNLNTPNTLCDTCNDIMYIDAMKRSASGADAQTH